MIHILTICSVLRLLSPPGDRTLLTWDGRKYTGTVTPAGEEYVVRTLGETHRVPARDVACIFEAPREVIDRADREFSDAKTLYDEAKDLTESNPIRNEKLRLAVEKTQTSVKLYRLAEPLYRSSFPKGFGKKIQTLLQFMRLCRGSMSSERTAGTSPEAPRILPLADPHFEFVPPEKVDAPWRHAEPLGAGQAALAERLVHPDAESRQNAVRLLSHPPAPLHLPELMRTLETETDADVVGELALGLPLFDTSAYLSKLDWARAEEDDGKRAIVFTIARRAGTRSAFDFLVDWFVDRPPSTNEDRARFASAFRQFRDSAGSRLKELLTKHRARALQSEILMQMGALRDPELVGMLLTAIPAYPDEAAAALTQIGKPAVPFILKGFGSSDHRIKKQCINLCRRLTGIRKINADHFEKWWAANRRKILEEEKTWWADQEAARYPVSPRLFRSYARGRRKG